MTEQHVVEYRASPTGTRFHLSSAFVRGVRGPVGGGKTTMCCWEVWLKAHGALPCRDGVRRSRWVVIRNTYAELKSTTIPSWEFWFGPERGPGFGQIVYDTPIRQRIRLEYPAEAGGPVELVMWFLALDRPEHVRKLQSLEVTGAWLNEASQLPKAVLDMITSRVGRYPYAALKPDDVPRERWPAWSGVIMDTNSMDDDHWWYLLAEVIRPDGYAFFSQPGGREPDAENLEYLPGGRAYYDRMAQGKDEDWIRVYIDNQYGAVRDGRVVFPEFNERLHVSETPLAVYRGLPIRIGWDFGLTPACVIGQLTPRGQLRILREVVTMDGTMGITQFARNVVRPLLDNEFPGMPVISFGDPGGNIRAQTDERTCMDILAAVGIPTRPTTTNLFTPRREAVAGFLSRLVDGEPAFLIDPSCHMLRKGLRGAYRYKRVAVAGEERYHDEPDKNAYSHVCEALQYLALPLASRPHDEEKAMAAAVARARATAAHGSRFGY